MFRVFQHMDGRLVVHEELGRAYSKLIEEVPQPCDFAADFEAVVWRLPTVLPHHRHRCSGEEVR